MMDPKENYPAIKSVLRRFRLGKASESISIAPMETTRTRERT